MTVYKKIFCSAWFLFVWSHAVLFSNAADVLPYKIVEDSTVSYISCDSITISATLSMPDNAESVPAVVLLSGSGKQTRDGDMAGHKMFEQISDYLTANGIAVLRFDDRGTGKSGGEYENSTTRDFALDALAGINYLKNRKEIDGRCIGLIGHSEGAAAACIAAADNPDVAYVVSLAGLMCDGLTSVIRQNYDLVEASQMKTRDKERYHQIMAIMAQTAYDYADSDSLEEKIYSNFTLWQRADATRFKALYPNENDTFRFPVYYYATEAAGRWYRFFIRYNPADYLKGINVPVLALFGEKDKMVNSELNSMTLRRNSLHNQNVTIRVFERLNHLLLPCEIGTPEEYRSIEAPIPESVLNTIKEWIIKCVGALQ